MDGLTQFLPRPYQVRIHDEFHDVVSHGARSVFIQSPCGSGKTRLACWFMKEFTSKEKRGIFSVHRDELLRNTQKSLYKFDGLSSGVIASGKTMQMYEPIQVCMMQTLANRLVKKSFDTFKSDYWIIDEAQHFNSSTWLGVHDNLRKRNPEMLEIALSATPWRYDGTGFDDIFEVLIKGPQPSELFESGDLVPMATFQVPYAVFEEVAIVETKEDGLTFSAKDQETKIIESFIFGDILKTYRSYIDGAPSIAYTPTVKCAELFAEKFTAAGYPSFAVSANTPEDLRKQYFDGLETGETCVLFNVDIATEGVDIPSVACVMDMSKTMSLTRWIQRIGRGARPAPGKKCGIYLDFCGNSHIHGDPNANRDWSLVGQVDKGKEKNRVFLSTCPNVACGYATAGRPKLCPFCGSEMREPGPERKLRYVDAELIEMSSNVEHAAVRETVAFYRDIRKLREEIPHILKADDRDIRKTIEELTRKMGLEDDFLNVVYADILKRKGLKSEKN